MAGMSSQICALTPDISTWWFKCWAGKAGAVFEQISQREIVCVCVCVAQRLGRGCGTEGIKAGDEGRGRVEAKGSDGVGLGGEGL